MERRIWSREEFMLVMNLYVKIPYGQFNSHNKEVQRLAKILERTPGAVAYKLVHFAGLDPYHKARGIKGLANPGNNAVKIYTEFTNNWEEMIFESEQLLAKYQNKNIEQAVKKQIEEEGEINLEDKKGTDVKRLIKTRVNQNVFRQVIISNYYSSCAICSLNLTSLLIASHILPWSKNEKERLNPENGICLCSIHDKAFECGFIGITEKYRIKLSPALKEIDDEETYRTLFERHGEQPINLPDKYYPNIDFLKQHYRAKFQK